MPELTEKQKAMLAYLKQELAVAGQAPSLRQMAATLSISHAAVAQTLKTLEEKGYLRREGRYSRSLELLSPSARPSQPESSRFREIPVVGRVAAGLPMYAQQEYDEAVVVDAALYRGLNLFALRVRGDSMINAGILDGDLAICEPRQFASKGEIVVALIEGEEATIKRFYLDEDRVELRPENDAMAPMYYDFSQILIQGKVIGIVRSPKTVARA